MAFRENGYTTLNEKLLLLTGLWPSPYPRMKILQIVLFYSFVGTVLIAQIAAIIQAGGNSTIILQILSTLIPSLMATVKYLSFHIQVPVVKEMMNKLEADWEMLKEDEMSFHIMQRYANEVRLFTIGLTIFLSLSLVMGLLIFLSPNFLDSIAPLNETRPKELFMLSEYFIDQNTYFYPLYFHQFMVILLSMLTIVATDTLTLVFLQHSCGMFKVTGNRLEHILDGMVISLPSSENEHIIRTRISRAVHVHRRAIDFINVVWTTFALSYYFLIFSSVCSITVNLIRFTRAATVTKNFEEIILSAAYLFILFVYSFMGNFAGQRLIDHSIEVFYKSYNAIWYKTTPQAQKMFLLIMQRSMKECSMGIANIFVSSFEGLSAIVSASFSYFTVLYSMQN